VDVLDGSAVRRQGRDVVGLYVAPPENVLVPALCSPPSMWAAARRSLAAAGVTVGKVKDWSIAGSLS
jgi:hypothetical protein